MAPRPLHPVFLALALASTAASATPAADPLEQCWLQQLRVAPADTTLAAIRQACQSLQSASDAPTPEPPAPLPEPASATTHRLIGEWAAYDNPYTLTLNRPAYFIFSRASAPPSNAPFAAASAGLPPQFERTEAKFQISLKAPLALNVFGAPVDVIGGYTNRSFWQMFNSQVSSPFRESNHEPEVWARWRQEVPLFGGHFRVFSLGLHHQSNGQSGPLSRSWNRVFLETLYEHKPVAFNLRLWKRLSESARYDDNPDIIDYMGRMELLTIAELGRHEVSATFRRNFSTERGAVQLDWSFPLYKNLRGYVQWFNGYGESLIDYNRRTRALGAGVQLGGWLLQ